MEKQKTFLLFKGTDIKNQFKTWDYNFPEDISNVLDGNNTVMGKELVTNSLLFLFLYSQQILFIFIFFILFFHLFLLVGG